MKNQFPGHFKPNDELIKQEWDRCIFIFDTNIILNLYRYSESTAREILKSIRSLGERIWLPYSVAKEYLDNRLDIIEEQSESYRKLKEELDRHYSDISEKLNSKRHPHIDDSNELVEKLKESFNLLKAKIDESHKKCISFESDWVIDEISKIFDGKTGNRLDQNKIDTIKADGQKRFKNKIPPGYSDNKKNENKFGDLIIWTEILEKVKSGTKSIILIIDDLKEDWWIKRNGKILGARPELVSEIIEAGAEFFYMYRLERFLQYFDDYRSGDVQKEAIDEIQSYSENEKRTIDFLKKEIGLVELYKDWFEKNNQLNTEVSKSIIGGHLLDQENLNRAMLRSIIDRYNMENYQLLRDTTIGNPLFDQNIYPFTGIDWNRSPKEFGANNPDDGDEFNIEDE